MASLSLHLAAHIADQALSRGHSQGAAPLCVVVVDDGGHVLVVKRHERCGPYRYDIALAKARGCIGMGMGGRDLAQRAAAHPAFYAAVNVIVPGGLLPLAGGVLVRDAAGMLLGAIGISGDTADIDEAFAMAGISGAGLAADRGNSE